MRSFIWKAVCVFSLVLNAAVVVSVGYHLWSSYGWFGRQLTAGAPESLPDDVKRAMDAPEGAISKKEMREKRRLLMEKKSEILDMIAAHPGDISAIKPRIDELLQLQAEVETAALTRISKVMAQLPEDKRQQFLSAIKSRACKGPAIGGAGFGHKGPKGRHMPSD